MFLFISKLYRQMYATTGIATDSARKNRANGWARWLAIPCQKLFRANPMPELQVPQKKAPGLVGLTADAGSNSFNVLG
jgi:hypothetical protein